MTGLFRNNRGVALLIALLITALLIALVFEFAYGTRVSLRAAVNFRDSQRAYYLANSGIFIFSKYKDLQNMIPQGEWGIVPVVSQGDTELRIRWEDEAGKINIGPQNYVTNLEWFRELLTNTGVSQEVEGKIKDGLGNRIYLPGQLHQVMSDEEFDKIKDFITVFSSGPINVNTAPETVLKSVLPSDRLNYILMLRKDKPIESLTGTDINSTLFTTTSNNYRVFSYARVGGYTKQAEAVIRRDSGKIPYWRIL